MWIDMWIPTGQYHICQLSDSNDSSKLLNQQSRDHSWYLQRNSPSPWTLFLWNSTDTAALTAPDAASPPAGPVAALQQHDVSCEIGSVSAGDYLVSNSHRPFYETDSGVSCCSQVDKHKQIGWWAPWQAFPIKWSAEEQPQPFFTKTMILLQWVNRHTAHEITIWLIRFSKLPVNCGPQALSLRTVQPKTK